MLQKSSEQVRLCRSRAYDAHAKAEAANDPAMKADFFAMEERWLALARSYEFSESLDAFTTSHVDWRDQSPSSPRAEHGDDARLQELSTMLIQEGNLDNLYGRILDAAVDLLRSKCGSMQVYLPERNELRLLAWRGFHPESAAYWQWVGLTHHSACAAALSAGRRIILADVENNPLLTGTRDLDEYRRCGVRSVQTTPLRSRSGDLLGMISTLWQDPHVPGERALRRLDVLARQAADLIERSKVEAQLRESEQKNRWLASIVNSSDDAIMSTDLAGRILSWNKGAERIFGYSAEEAIGSVTTQLITPENSEFDRAVLARIQAGEPFISHEAALQRKGGQAIMASLTVSPIKDAHGAIIGISSVVRDITDQKRQDEHIAVLAREAEHRTKNVLAAVQAVVNLSRADDTDGLKRAVSGRIEALARVHTLFAESRWSGADLLELTRQELAPFCEDDGARLRIDGPKVSLRNCAAQGAAMVLHELATNAAKYGALSTSEGRLDVAWSVAGDGAVLMRWIESKGPPTRKAKHIGVGLAVMEKVVNGQLKGELHLDWRPDGLACDLKFRP